MNPRTGRRLDQAALDAGIAPTREKARALILAGRILVDGERWDKPGWSVPEGARVELVPGKRPFVSRGGEKLAGALEALALDPAGWRCLDVGASTGGFTDALLRRGAVHVTAVDVGRGLIDASLRNDERVRVVEGLNARYLESSDVEPPYDLAVVDVSFISLSLVLPRVVAILAEGRVLALVKPQFESERKEVSAAGGVIKDPALRARAVQRVVAAIRGEGWQIAGVSASALAGPSGNREIFVLAVPLGGLSIDQVTAKIEEEVARGER